MSDGLSEAERIASEKWMATETPQVDAILSVLLCNVLMSDGEVRLLAYQAVGGSLDMPVSDIASLFGWSERKAYYVLQTLEEKGMLRRVARGRKRDR